MYKNSRHYRAAKKEAAYKPSPANGIFIRNDTKTAIVCIWIILWIVVFIKGIIIGYSIADKK